MMGLTSCTPTYPGSWPSTKPVLEKQFPSSPPVVSKNSSRQSFRSQPGSSSEAIHQAALDSSPHLAGQVLRYRGEAIPVKRVLQNLEME